MNKTEKLIALEIAEYIKYEGGFDGIPNLAKRIYKTINNLDTHAEQAMNLANNN